MKRIVILNIVIFNLLVIYSCNTKTNFSFKLPNGSIIEQATLMDLEQNNTIKYEQYFGFVINYHDSLFKKALLLIENNSSIVGSEVLNDTKINQLKNKKIEAIKFTYELNNQSQNRDFLFEEYILNKYKEFDKKEEIQNGFELYKKGKKYVSVKLNVIAIPNYSVVIYPTQQ